MDELMNVAELDSLEKMARMAHAGVSQIQIASVVGLSEGRVSQIMDSQEYINQISAIEAESFEQMDLMNRGWDGIEERSLAIVFDHLQGVPDPDFALKAAVVANKAVRRGQHVNKPIQIQAGLQTVIELNATFIGQLQQNFQVEERKIEKLPLKTTNMLSVKGVHSMLGMTKTVEGFEVIDDSTNAITHENAESIDAAIEEI